MRKQLQIACAVLLLALVEPGHAQARDPVQSTLDALAASGRLSADLHRTYSADWLRARRSVRHLHGAARGDMEGVLANTAALARDRLLATRTTPAFLTLERNYEWFWSERRRSAVYGARSTFGDSPIIFEFYPGSGWQIQPLANFGRLSGLAGSKRSHLTTLTAYAEALLPLAVNRDGFLAFEYYFPWSGGRPGWMSGMAAATGVAALGRVWQRTGDIRYRNTAERMLGAFFTAPPWGIRLGQGPGRAHYLQYSQAPRLLVGNAFAQSLIALDDYSRRTGSARASLALQRGLRQAETGLALFDTGAWSLYSRQSGMSRGEESDLHYHQLFEGFLEQLCARFPAGPFCRVHDHFARYETEPVRIAHLERGGMGTR